MMTQFDCISSRTESQTNNLASEKREREEKGWGLGGVVKIVVLMKARFLTSSAVLLMAKKRKRFGWRKKGNSGSGPLDSIVCNVKS